MGWTKRTSFFVALLASLFAGLPVAADLSPGRSGPELVLQLDSKDFHTRQEATRRLIAMDAEALPLLEKAPANLGEEAKARVDFIRLMVAPPALPTALATRIQQAIHKLVAWKDHGPVYSVEEQNRAVAELRKIGPVALPAMYRMMADPKCREVGALTYIIEGWERAKAALPLTCLLVIAPADSRRADIAHALGELGDPVAVPALMTLLTDQYWYTRAKAAQALGKLGDTRPLLLLSDTAINDAHHATRRDSFQAVLALDRDAGVKLCIGVLDHPNLRFFERALDYIAEHGDPSCVEPLNKVALSDGIPDKLRRKAIGCIVNCGEEQIVPLLIGLLEDREAFVRDRAAQALAITRDASMYPHRQPADTPEAITARRAAWEGWWKANGHSFRWAGVTRLDELYGRREWGPSVNQCRISIALEKPRVRPGESLRIDTLLNIEPGDPPHRVLDFDFSRFGGNYPFTPILTRHDSTPVKPVFTEPDTEKPPAAIRISFFDDGSPPRRWVILPWTEEGRLKAYDTQRRQWDYYDLPPGAYRLQLRYFSHENRGQPRWPKELFSNTVQLTVLPRDD